MIVWYTLLEIPTRILGALFFFGLGVSELFFYPIAYARRALFLAVPPFFVSLIFVLLSINSYHFFVDTGFLLFLIRLALLFLAFAYTLDNYIRYRTRRNLHHDITRINFIAFRAGSHDLDISKLVETLEELGWTRRYGSPATPHCPAGRGEPKEGHADR